MHSVRCPAVDDSLAAEAPEERRASLLHGSDADNYSILRGLKYGAGPFVYDVGNIEQVLLSSYQADSWERCIGYL